MVSSKRIIYKNNPLVEVVCQVNFPAILSIESMAPIQFQEKIREFFPQYRSGNEYENEFAFNFKGENLESQSQKHTITKIHNFISQDNIERVVVTKNRVSFSVKKYEKWESFFEKFNKIFTTFNETYKPNYFNRIGLRYINIIDKDKLNLSSCNWDELLSSRLIGFYNDHSNNFEIVNTSVKSEIVSNMMNARIQSDIFVDDNSKTRCYRIDCDYFIVDNYSKDVVEEKMSLLHSNFQSFFDDSITQKLRDALGPI